MLTNLGRNGLYNDYADKFRSNSEGERVLLTLDKFGGFVSLEDDEPAVSKGQLIPVADELSRIP